MAQRTTALAVQTLLGGTNPNSNWDGVTDVQQYIDGATLFTDDVVAGAAGEGVAINAAKAEYIERCISAHYYTKFDPTYQSRSTSGALGSFVRDPKNPEPYKSMAIEFDTSGWVNAMVNRLVASGGWLGKTPSEQIPVWERY